MSAMAMRSTWLQIRTREFRGNESWENALYNGTPVLFVLLLGPSRPECSLHFVEVFVVMDGDTVVDKIADAFQQSVTRLIELLQLLLSFLNCFAALELRSFQRLSSGNILGLHLLANFFAGLVIFSVEAINSVNLLPPGSIGF